MYLVIKKIMNSKATRHLRNSPLEITVLYSLI